MLNFGGVRVGDAATRELVIRNNTGRTVRVQIAGSTAGVVFQWQAVDVSLAHDTEQRVTVTFRPAANMFSSEQLVVESATAISPETIGLTGKGGIGGFPTGPPG